MKQIFLSLSAVLLSACLAGLVHAGETQGVDFSQKHASAACSVCHAGSPNANTVNQNACIQCHGNMSQIQLPPNKFGKDAHHSPHYADLVACTECHREHGKSRSLCEDCHITR